MPKKKETEYTFIFKRRELITIILGIIVTHIMVFVLGVQIGKDYLSKPETEVITETPNYPVESILKDIKIKPAPKSTLNYSTEESPIVERPIKTTTQQTVKAKPRLYIQAGAFSKAELAINLARRLKDKGYKAEIVRTDRLIKVIIGPYSDEERMKEDINKLKRYEKIYGYPIRY